jgi:hypothetical protein
VKPLRFIGWSPVLANSGGFSEAGKNAQITAIPVWQQHATIPSTQMIHRNILFDMTVYQIFEKSALREGYGFGVVNEA